MGGLGWFSLIQFSSGGLALRLMSYLHTGGAFGGIIMGVLQIERAIAGAVLKHLQDHRSSYKVVA